MTMRLWCVILAWLPLAAFADDYAPALWRIVDKGVQVHLFGSVHVGNDDMYPLPGPVNAAFEGAGLLAVEIHVDDEDPDTVAKYARTVGYARSHRPLSRRIGRGLWSDLRLLCRQHDLDCTQFEPMQPWYAAFTLGPMVAEKAGFTLSQGIDFHFIDRARGVKPVVGLERFEDQLALFGLLDEAGQVQYLRETLAQMGRGVDKTLNEIVSVWRAGDVEGMDRLANGPMRQAGLVYDYTIVRRNRQIARAIDRLIGAGQSVFVVVGAAHLAGPDSVQVALRRYGWTTERVDY